MTCTVCNSSDVREVRAAEVERIEQVSFSYTFSPESTKTFRVVRCRQCTHMFCQPLPPPSLLVGRYEKVIDEEYLRHTESRRLAAREVLRIIEPHAARGARKRNLLDVGCATGDFVEEARGMGYEAEGLELSSWSSAIARERQLVVHEATLADHAARHPGTFDVVSLLGVIEHFARPHEEMDHIAALLRPGGIVVVWTGDVASPLARVLGRRWWYWQGQHVQYFTRRSLSRLAADAGLAHVTTARYPFVATHQTLSNSLRRYRMHAVISTALRPVFRLRPVLTLRLPGEMLFIARKT